MVQEEGKAVIMELPQKVATQVEDEVWVVETMVTVVAQRSMALRELLVE